MNNIFGISEVIKVIGNIADDLITTDKERLELALKEKELEVALLSKVHETPHSRGTAQEHLYSRLETCDWLDRSSKLGIYLSGTSHISLDKLYLWVYRHPAPPIQMRC